MRMGVKARVGAAADRRHRLRLCEDFRVRTDADLQILRPRALCDQRRLEPLGLREPGFSLRRSSPTSRPISARMRGAPSGLPRARSSITRSSIEADEGDARRLQGLQSTGASSHGFDGLRVSGGVLARLDTPIRSPRPCAARRGVGLLGEIAHGRETAAASRTRHPRGSPPCDGPPRSAAGRARRARRRNRPRAGFPRLSDADKALAFPLFCSFTALLASRQPLTCQREGTTRCGSASGARRSKCTRL